MQGELNKNVVEGEKGERGRPSRPLFSLLSLQAQMFIVCINYWGPENVPHSGEAAQKLRLITFPFPRSLCLNSLAVNPSRHTSSSDSWETELLLFSNTTQSWPHISTVLFRNKVPGFYISFLCYECSFDPHIIAAFTRHIESPPHFIVVFLTTLGKSYLSFSFLLSSTLSTCVCLSGVSSRCTCGIKPTNMGARKQTIRGPSLTG